jgi:adenylylsulfate kinase
MDSSPENIGRDHRRGVTIWLTGLPSSGKSTIARRIADLLASRGDRVEVLDGDEVRSRLGVGGYDRSSRDANVDRIGWLAQLLSRNGVTTVVAAISPYRAARANVRANHAEAGIPFVEVHVAAPVECCTARDVKGLYARQRVGQLVGLTGVDDPYEAPIDPEVRLRTDRELMAFLTDRGLA